MKNKRYSLLIFLLVFLFSFPIFSQKNDYGTLAIGWSSKVEYYYRGKDYIPPTTPIGLFAQYDYGDRISIYSSVYYSHNYLDFANTTLQTETRTIHRTYKLREKSFIFEHAIKYHFWKKRSAHFFGVGIFFRDNIQLDAKKSTTINISPPTFSMCLI